MNTGQSEGDGQSGFARRAAWLTTANSIAFGLSFIAPLMLVRTLSQTEFGVYKQAFQILTSTISLLNLQVASTAYYFAPRAPEKPLDKRALYRDLLATEKNAAWATARYASLTGELPPRDAAA